MPNPYDVRAVRCQVRLIHIHNDMLSIHVFWRKMMARLLPDAVCYPRTVTGIEDSLAVRASYYRSLLLALRSNKGHDEPTGLVLSRTDEGGEVSALADG
jgi:hypothetical protein